MPRPLHDLTRLVIEEISLVDEPANDEARAVIVKSRNRSLALGQEGDPDMADMNAINAALKDAETEITTLAKGRDDATARADKAVADLGAATEALTKAQARVKELEAEVAKGKAAETDEEAVLKALPESVRKRLVDAEEAVAKAREREEEAAEITKAKTFVKGDDEAQLVGGLLLRVRKARTTAEDAATVERLLKAARAQADTSALFKAAGTTEGGDADDPMVALNAAAAAIRKGKPELTEAQAFAEATAANPKLYDAYVAKRRPAAA